ncbi:MAG: hypothetical protein HY301_14620 [Verrucomicrobia bacterium]|nr:hypothetical protein [Verrucomicrobiota bacterium]
MHSPSAFAKLRRRFAARREAAAIRPRLAALGRTFYIIGDSHVSVFAGRERLQPFWPERRRGVFPNLRVFHRGPVLAWSLAREGATARGRELAFEVLRAEVPPGAEVVFCFGEIDCRVHVQRQMERQGAPMATVIGGITANYAAFLADVARAGWRPVVWAVTGSSLNTAEKVPGLPQFGSPRERNEFTRCFNTQMRAVCVERDHGFASIFSRLVTNDLQTRGEFLFDGWHLGNRALPLVADALEGYVRGERQSAV